MGKYTVIAEVGTRLAEILTQELVPDLIQDKNGIGLCCPSDKGDFVLGIYLYDIRENGDLRVSGMVNSSFNQQKFPPMYLSLYYMITIYAGSDVKFRAVQEQRILGRVIQVLNDHNLLPSYQMGADSGGIDLRIEFLDMEIEDKMKIWNTVDQPYRTSLFYRVSPVELESTRSRTVTRVTEVDMTIKEQES